MIGGNSMKYLVLENDHELSRELQRYLTGKDAEVVYGADHRDSDEFLEMISRFDVLLFEPTLVTYGQYNLTMMLLYHAIQENSLRISRVEIFKDHGDIVHRLEELWEDKRTYLDEVLKRVELFAVSNYEERKIDLFQK